jgi:hypothetical protein
MMTAWKPLTAWKPPTVGALGALALAACSSGAPQGVDKAKLDEAISRAIGDPNSCLLIAEAGSGKTVYRYNSHTACANTWPACEAAGERTAADVLKLTLADKQPRLLSCNTQSDASRGVGWASGPLKGGKYVYAAVMEGDRAFPGRMMADRLSGAFSKAGLAP